MSRRASLDSLPPELLIQVFCFLDLPSLANMVRTTRTFHTVAASYPEHLCRAVCTRQGLAGAKTGGAASPLAAEGLADKALTDELDPEELREVVAQQNSMQEAFKTVDCWSSYARLRWAIDCSWRHGRATWCPVTLDVDDAVRAGLEAVHLFWRFKLDTIAGLIVVTGLLGGYYAFDMSGKLAWSCRLPAAPFPHVELSSSHLSMSISGRTWIIWRYTSSPPPASFAKDMFEQLRPHFRLHNGREVGYVPHAVLSADRTCSATKLRYPILLATSDDASTAYHWNITDSSLHTLDTSRFTQELHEDRASYVELDGVNTFIAGHRSITVWKNQEHASDAGRVTTWPPAPPPDYRLLQPLTPEPHYRDRRDQQWSAVHHDGRGRHLVAISERGREDGIARLMWTVDYDSTIWSEDREEIEQKTLVLVTNDADLVQLAVENDRAVFVAAHRKVGNSLWLLNLRTHKGLSDFARDPPRPICLAYPLPTVMPPSRVEMTSTEIFVPSSSRLYPPSVPDRSDPAYPLAAAFRACLVPGGAQTTVSDPPSVAPLSFKWQTLDGQTLKNYEDESIKQDSDELRQMERNWRRVCRLEGDLPNGGSDSLLSLSFVPQTEQTS
ncbi:hypothetical protein JCM1841_006314 [Sporobolomyces salmonicolor]